MFLVKHQNPIHLSMTDLEAGLAQLRTMKSAGKRLGKVFLPDVWNVPEKSVSLLSYFHVTLSLPWPPSYFLP